MMSDKILVTYASRTGSTAGVADAIGEALSARGAEVDVRPMNEVSVLTPYAAVVLGSAIRHQQWLPEAMEWLRTHRAELVEKPVAAFQVCMTMATSKESYRQGVPEWMAPVRALVRPVSEGFFAGVLELAKVPSWRQRLGFWVSIKLGVWREGDHRDWAAIRAWADALPAQLQG